MKTKYIHSIKKTFSVIFFVAISLIASNFYAQTTNIPDPNFEQALIDLGIDSDGIVNGLVLTSDIESITTLDVSIRQISDLTGIEGFAALEELNASINNIASLNLHLNNNLKKLLVDDNLFLSNLDVTNNIQLEYLYCDLSSLSELDLSNNILLKELSLGKDQPAPSNGIENLDLSNNPALEKLHLINMVYLEYVDIKSGNNQILIDVLIYCETHSGATCLPLTCMEVDDLTAAQTNQYPYSEWDAYVNYSEDCSLGITTLDEKVFSIFPNPVKNELTIRSNKENENLIIKIFNIEGKLLKTQSLDSVKQVSIDVSNHANGIYFLNIEDANGNVATKKFIKE